MVKVAAIPSDPWQRLDRLPPPRPRRKRCHLAGTSPPSQRHRVGAANSAARKPLPQNKLRPLITHPDQTGLEPRTIRSYVERGLVAGPDSMGRGARYPRETLDRLQVLQLLRAANREVSLDQLRVVLHSLSPNQVRAIADGSLRIGALVDTDAPGTTTQPSGTAASSASPSDALAYLRSLKTLAKRPPMESTAGQERPIAPGDSDLSVLANAAQALAALAGLSAAARSVRGEAWYRLELTPDVELSVRGDYGPEELAQLHRIADALKILLTKGAPR